MSDRPALFNMQGQTLGNTIDVFPEARKAQPSLVRARQHGDSFLVGSGLASLCSTAKARRAFSNKALQSKTMLFVKSTSLESQYLAFVTIIHAEFFLKNEQINNVFFLDPFIMKYTVSIQLCGSGPVL